MVDGCSSSVLLILLTLTYDMLCHEVTWPQIYL